MHGGLALELVRRTCALGWNIQIEGNSRIFTKPSEVVSQDSLRFTHMKQCIKCTVQPHFLIQVFGTYYDMKCVIGPERVIIVF